MPLIPLKIFEDMRKVRGIGAYTIDTNIFHACKFMFDKPPLKCHPLQHEDLFFVIPEIIHMELLKEYVGMHDWIEGMLQKSRISSLSKVRSIQQALKTINLQEECAREIDDFLSSKNSIILNTSQYADFNQILKMYFETLPPFEQNQEKKHEFPDAIALATLEGYGEQMDRNILVISNDRGWKDYCGRSGRLFMIDEAIKGDPKTLHLHNDILKPQIVNEAQLIENIRNILETSEDARETIKNGLQDFINENLHLFIPDVKKAPGLSSYFYGEMKSADLLDLDFSQLQLLFTYMGNGELIAGSPMNARLSCMAAIEKLEWDDKNKRGTVIESRTAGIEASVEFYINVEAMINNHDLKDLTITGCDVLPDEVEITFKEF